MKGKEVQA